MQWPLPDTLGTYPLSCTCLGYNVARASSGFLCPCDDMLSRERVYKGVSKTTGTSQFSASSSSVVQNGYYRRTSVVYYRVCILIVEVFSSHRLYPLAVPTVASVSSSSGSCCKARLPLLLPGAATHPKPLSSLNSRPRLLTACTSLRSTPRTRRRSTLPRRQRPTFLVAAASTISSTTPGWYAFRAISRVI